MGTEDETTFIGYTLEAVIEAFELEVAFLLLKESTPNRYSIGGSFGAEFEGAELKIDDNVFALVPPRILESDGQDGRLLHELGMVQALSAPFVGRNGEVMGAIVAGVTADGLDIYTDITKDLCSSLGVLARQTGAVWVTKQLNEEAIQQNKRLHDLTESYSRFVPFEFLKLLARSSIEEIGAGDSVALDLGVLFADIRGFTTLSEQMVSLQVFQNLNEFLSQIEPPIAKNGGFINQYLGDAVMALFPDRVDDALRCAIEMRQAVRPSSKSHTGKGQTQMDFGLGIHRGPLTLGALGGGKRLDSNVIGDAANVASRVEGLTRYYGVAALTTSELTEKLVDPSQFVLREIDNVTVKGRVQSMTLIEILDCDSEAERSTKLGTLDQFNDARAMYRNQEFSAARKLFNHCLDIVPADGVARLMAARCLDLESQRNRESWGGIWHWDKK